MADSSEGRGTFTRELRIGPALRVAALMTAASRAPESPVGIVPIALGGQQFWDAQPMVREGSWRSDTDYNRLLHDQTPADRRWPYRPGGFGEYRLLPRIEPGYVGYLLLYNNGVDVDMDELAERAALLERGATDAARLQATVEGWYQQAGVPLPELPEPVVSHPTMHATRGAA